VQDTEKRITTHAENQDAAKNDQNRNIRSKSDQDNNSTKNDSSSGNTTVVLTDNKLTVGAVESAHASVCTTTNVITPSEEDEVAHRRDVIVSFVMIGRLLGEVGHHRHADMLMDTALSLANRIGDGALIAQVCVCVCVYVRINTYLCIHMHIYIYIYIYG
jgi:hypothetical protein